MEFWHEEYQTMVAWPALSPGFNQLHFFPWDCPQNVGCTMKISCSWHNSSHSCCWHHKQNDTNSAEKFNGTTGGKMQAVSYQVVIGKIR